MSSPAAGYDAHVDGFQGHVEAGRSTPFSSPWAAIQSAGIAVLARPPAYSISWHGLDAGSPITPQTFSKNGYGRFRESDTLRRLFESLVQRCIAERLVSADGFAVCASLIAANASKLVIGSKPVSGSPRRSRNPRPALSRNTLPPRTMRSSEPRRGDTEIHAAISDPLAQWSSSAAGPARGESEH